MGWWHAHHRIGGRQASNSEAMNCGVAGEQATGSIRGRQSKHHEHHLFRGACVRKHHEHSLIRGCNRACKTKHPEHDWIAGWQARKQASKPARNRKHSLEGGTEHRQASESIMSIIGQKGGKQACNRKHDEHQRIRGRQAKQVTGSIMSITGLAGGMQS